MTSHASLAYQDAIELLYTLRWFGARLALDAPLKLASLAGNPERRLRFIHVAGTNGKGSTCAMLESIYRAAGWRVGLFTSPHLVSFRERIQVDREMIAETDVVRRVEEMRGYLKHFTPDDHPTFFEAVTVMALRHFAAQGCELVIWETGLGGRLDATNIVMPLASVITNIQLDHQQWLGETLERIASEKAGIIKPGVPVITGAEKPEVLQVIRQVAAGANAPLLQARPETLPAFAATACDLPLTGEHQRRNAALAIATVETLRTVLPVSEAAIHHGLKTVQWPGRFQVINRPSGRTILLDGAHNVAGAEVFATTLEARFPTTRRTLILGILRDKDWAGICRLLAPMGSRILLVPVQNERTSQPGELAEICRAANPDATIACHASLSQALTAAAQDAFVAVSGSLYLVGEAMQLLGLAPGSLRDERGLNEWQSTDRKA